MSCERDRPFLRLRQINTKKDQWVDYRMSGMIQDGWGKEEQPKEELKVW